MRGLSNRMILACLLHDASECYMSDVPRPFKKQLPEYQLLARIYEKFLGSDLSSEEAMQLKAIDDAMLAYDLVELLGEPQSREMPEIHIKPDYSVRPFEAVEQEYLEIFEKYTT